MKVTLTIVCLVIFLINFLLNAYARISIKATIRDEMYKQALENKKVRDSYEE